MKPRESSHSGPCSPEIALRAAMESGSRAVFTGLCTRPVGGSVAFTHSIVGSSWSEFSTGDCYSRGFPGGLLFAVMCALHMIVCASFTNPLVQESNFDF